MGRHASPRRTAQRAIAVSAGTLVLCLGAAGPALASSAPAPTPLSGTPLSGLLPTTDPIPVPQPVSDAVQKVSDLAGVANPLAPTAAKHRHHRTAATTPKTHLTLGHQGTATPPPRHSRTATTAHLTPVAYPVAGLRGTPSFSTATPTGRHPAVANPTITMPITEAAGQSALPPLPANAPVQDTARILLIALATMLMGALTSGHLKALQQQRNLAW